MGEDLGSYVAGTKGAHTQIECDIFKFCWLERSSEIIYIYFGKCQGGRGLNLEILLNHDYGVRSLS